jgi:hypothetical protein
MRKSINFFLFCSMSFLFFSCKDKPVPPVVKDYVDITVQPVYNGENLLMDSIYVTQEGYKIKITDLKFYVTSLQNGGTNLSQAALFDFRETGTLLLHQEADYLKFGSLQGILGVDTTLNHDDPSAFPTSSPLNISNAGTMHWGWNPGYIFVSVEGKVDTLIDGIDNLDHNFSFHTGTDQYLQSLSFSSINWQTISTHQHTFALKLDVYSIFASPGQSIDLRLEYLAHSSGSQAALSQKFGHNFKSALTPY